MRDRASAHAYVTSDDDDDDEDDNDDNVDDDDDDDKGYVEFYKASRVLFVKKSVEPVTPAHLTLSRTRTAAYTAYLRVYARTRAGTYVCNVQFRCCA